VEVTAPLGSETYVTATVQESQIMARFPSRSQASPGDNVDLVYNPDHLHIFDRDTGRNVLVPDAPAATAHVDQLETELATPIDELASAMESLSKSAEQPATLTHTA